MYGHLMSRDAKSLTSTLALFYAVGIFLALRAYAFNSIDDFAIILTFWLKETLAFVLIGAGYCLYYIICGSAGRRPKAPLRFLDRAFLSSVAALGVLLLIRG
jgi:hypothetical protein